MGRGFGIRDSGFARAYPCHPGRSEGSVCRREKQIPRCARDDRKHAFPNPESRIPNPESRIPNPPTPPPLPPPPPPPTPEPPQLRLDEATAIAATDPRARTTE